MHVQTSLALASMPHRLPVRPVELVLLRVRVGVRDARVGHADRHPGLGSLWNFGGNDSLSQEEHWIF